MSYSQAWLEDPSAIRGLLVEVDVYNVVSAATTTLYLSTMGYVTTTADVVYNPILTNSIQLTESLDISGSSAGLSYGDVEINNPTGEYDSWLDPSKYIWVNKPIRVYYGDPTWVCADIISVHSTFQLIFDGIVADIDSKSRDTLAIKLRDKLERLNTPITENVLGTTGTWAGGQNNSEAIKPLIFGEVFNVEPLLTDPSTFGYLFNDGEAELLIEIRDNGVPIYTHNGTAVTLNPVDRPNTINLTTGTFTLGSALAGTCTVSVQGVKKSIQFTSSSATLSNTYDNNIAKIIALIVTQYGKADSKFSLTTDLDFANLNTFSAANTQKVGIYINDRANILTVCQELASSIGAQLYINRLGKLQLLRLGVPTSDTSVSITEDDILYYTLTVSNKTEVVASTILGYCKNWTTQAGLLTGIPQGHKDIFATEWVNPSSPYVDTSIKSLYKLESLPQQKDTLLIKESDATAEATRLTNYFKVPRTIYKFTGTSRLLSLKLGQAVTLAHSRFNLSSGKSGQVVSLSPDWLNGTVEVEVLV